ncbi:MAG: ABC transporter permease [Candidatus Merdivicinus sp.]|jgi:putative aldouronate transport system permease protein
MKKAKTTAAHTVVGQKSFWQYVRSNKGIYLFLLPGFIYLIIFNYIPMYGIVIAFQDFSPVKGIWNSPWIGWKNFEDLFTSSQFPTVLRNSITFSLMRLAAGFPAPLIFALLLNEVRNMKLKRAAQTISYIPHFISWVVVCGMVKIILSPTGDGLFNSIIGLFGIEPMNLLISPKYFRLVIIVAEIWKEVGWGAIVYLAALSGIDPTYYEAAVIDGATRLQRIWYITLPAISNTIVVLLVLRTGRILNNGFEQIFLLYSPMVYEVADVFETYTYRVGLLDGRFSYSTAIDLFKSLVGIVMIYTTNYISRLLGERALW